jgi:hypothetical protein
LDLTLASYSIACLDCRSSHFKARTPPIARIQSSQQKNALKSASSQVKNVKIPSESGDFGQGAAMLPTSKP